MTVSDRDAYLEAGHLSAGLKVRTISSGAITVAQQGALMAVNLAAMMVLARLLGPSDFGVLAMAYAVIGFVRAFAEAGLSTATIQRDNLTHAQVSNLFWANAGLGGLVTLGLLAVSPLVGWFYREPRATLVTALLSSGFLIASLQVQHIALLKRQMRYAAVGVIDVTAAVLGSALGCASAWLGAGYWSLVGMQVTTSVVGCVAAWGVCRWRPQRLTRGVGTRPLLKLGFNLTASGFLWSLARGLDMVLVGRLFGSDSLGVYSRAAALLNRPLEQAVSPLGGLFVPALSRLQNQPERYRSAALLVHSHMNLFGCIFAGVACSLSAALVYMVLGPNWAESIPILRAFSLYGLYVPLIGTAGWLLSSQGRGADFLRLSVCTSGTTVLSFAAGALFGVQGVAFLFSLSCLTIQLPVTYWIAGRTGPVTSIDLWKVTLQHLPVCGLVALSGSILNRVLTLPASPADLGLAVAVSTIVGLGGAWLWPGSRPTVVAAFDATRMWLRRNGDA